MDKNKVINEVIRIIKEELSINVENVDRDSKIMEDLSLSSLDMMLLLSFLEKEYNVQFSVEKLRNIITIEDLVNNIITD